MPFLFTCPECQTKTQVEDRFRGMAGQCVTCGAKIQMPEASSESPALPSATGPQSNQRTFGWIAATMVGILLIGSLLFAVIRFGSQTISTLASNREQTATIRNLEKIAAAMNAYAADNDVYPPPMTVDANNQPLHSWRVLLLPYLGEEDLYNQFDLNLSWNHPVNRDIAQYEMPSVYHHPSGDALGLYSQSGYYLITGPGTLFPPQGPLGPSDVTDDPSQTILVTEAIPTTSSALWTEPIDLDINTMRGNLGTNLGNEPGGLTEGGVAIATVDQRGHFVPNSIDPTIVRALITVQGDERLADDVLD
ncbi:hypothetical protein K227x_09020 [Rubripirellula lacrimiformis]|uniref:DUF1559 domain-containing protein n=1 Tax=Rubripirellula lacrimiformis TaxID=1930273 RepID=A0A517N5X5_9BACT|nr:DUF1559 domain-containing protein [Rubripirellula lacrimiformis]QDT02524.1 hypothetical protein K227x_09020 [Rubripirellula lacrimiformis]